MKAAFKVFVGKDLPPEHPTFEAAFAVFFTQMLALIRGGTSLQMVETGCWIEGIFELAPGGKTLSAPLYFYDARDFAYDLGLLVSEGGKPVLADPAPSVDPSAVASRFADSGLAELRGVIEMGGALLASMRETPDIQGP